MANHEKLHVVFGATGDSGRAVIRELIRQGKHVRAVNRSGKALPPGIELVQTDAAAPVSTRAACRGAKVVYNCVGVPLPQWTTHLLPILKGVTEGAAAAEAKLIFADNVHQRRK